MPVLNITQSDYSVLKQPMQERYIKMELLDFNLQVLDEISGNLISFSINVNADSDIRRTCTAELVVIDNSFDIQPGGKIWLDRIIKPYIGTLDNITGEIIWNNQGVFIVNAPTWRYDATTNALTLSGIDLVAKLTGLRNGQLEGIPHIITTGSNVREAIIATLGLGGFTQYNVSECINRDGQIQSVPYDIEISAGGTVWDILCKLRDILPQYQMYFDANGVFHYELMPTGENEPSVLDDDLLSYILLSEVIDTNFENVKNYIEVWGAIHDTENFATNISTSAGTQTLTINSVTSMFDGLMVAWEQNTSYSISSGIKLKVNNFAASRLVDMGGNNVLSLPLDNGNPTYYVAIYTNNHWLFLGHLQAQAVWADYNSDSPFYVNGSVGQIRYVCSGGEYDNIQSDYLALERAKLEVYWRCRLNDTISLTTIPIPWLDVNLLFSHAIKGGNILEQYMIDSISADYGAEGTMTIVAHKYYPYYPSY